MDWATVISLVGKRIGNRSDQDDNILLGLQLAQATDMEGGDFLPWFLKAWDTSLATAADTETMALPTGFLRFPEELDGGLWLTNDDGRKVRLIKNDLAFMRERYATSARDFPRYFDYDGTNFYFAPIPDKVYTGEALFYKQDDAPAASGSNGWSTWAPDLCIYLGARHTLEILGEDFSTQFGSIERARQRLMNVDTMRRTSGQEG